MALKRELRVTELEKTLLKHVHLLLHPVAMFYFLFLLFSLSLHFFEGECSWIYLYPILLMGLKPLLTFSQETLKIPQRHPTMPGVKQPYRPRNWDVLQRGIGFVTTWREVSGKSCIVECIKFILRHQCQRSEATKASEEIRERIEELSGDCSVSGAERKWIQYEQIVWNRHQGRKRILCVVQAGDDLQGSQWTGGIGKDVRLVLRMSSLKSSCCTKCGNMLPS